MLEDLLNELAFLIVQVRMMAVTLGMLIMHLAEGEGGGVFEEEEEVGVEVLMDQTQVRELMSLIMVFVRVMKVDGLLEGIPKWLKNLNHS